MIELASAEEIALILAPPKENSAVDRALLLENIRQAHEASEKERIAQWQARIDRARAALSIPKLSGEKLKAKRRDNFAKARAARSRTKEDKDEDAKFERVWKERHEDKSYYGVRIP